ncbi:MAG: hypothetical protein ACR2IG_15050 [Roseomonas sp.]
MGGLFEAPKPKITVQPAAPPAPVPEIVASEARIENCASASRGLPGTIATSARGLLSTMPDFLTTRRSLLGE